MIYTITLNPALDRTLWIKKIQPDESLIKEILPVVDNLERAVNSANDDE